MKRFLLLFFVFAASCPAFASDTLTRAQIYNFQVGDTFDYREHITSIVLAEIIGTNDVTSMQALDSLHYSRCVIQAGWYSGGADTLYIQRAWIYPLPVRYDTLVLDSLNYPEFEIDSSPFYSDSGQYYFDSTSSYNCATNEEHYFGGFSNVIDILYGQGLGRVSYVRSAGEYTLYLDSINLIYYSTHSGVWGTPYNIDDSSALIHFTPLPEECATWISSQGYNYICASPVKISTGARIPYNGHTYVEMRYSAVNPDNSFTSDSLAGYFRNDTANAKVYLYSDTGEAPYLTYDFSVPAGGYVLSLSKVLVGGQQRIFWYEGCYGGGPFPGGYIEGVGGASGLTAFTCPLYSQGYYFNCYNLTCFSVCGNTLYPYDSTADCTLAGINNIPPPISTVKIYPTLNDGRFTAEVTGANLQSAQLLITDITGREIKRCPLNNQLNEIDIQPCASGMYIWQIVSGEQLLQTGKMVKM